MVRASNISAGWVLIPAVAGTSIFSYFMGRQSKTQPRLIVSLIFALLIGASLINVASTEDVWLPRERLVFESEENALIGYVLKTSGDHFIILNDDPRIVIEKQGPLRRRNLCYPRGEGYEQALVELGQIPGFCD